MLTGFGNFFSDVASKVKSFFSSLSVWFRGVTGSTRIEAVGGRVHCTFPDYSSLAEGLPPTPVGEATVSGDKGRHIAAQMRQTGVAKRDLTAAQTSEVNDNVARIGQHLGMAFETGIVLYLVNRMHLPLDAKGITLEKVRELHEAFLYRVRNSYVTTGKSTATRENFLGLLDHHVAAMAEEIYSKSLKLMNCERLASIQYIGADQLVGNVSKPKGNIAGADLIIECESSGELQYFSTKYVSNPHSSVAKKTTAETHQLLGGKGARSDAYYAKLTRGISTPVLSAQAILLDLWESLKNGHAVEAVESSSKVRLDGGWVAKMFSSLMDGDFGTKPAFVNYARGQSAVGEFSPAIQRDFRTDRNGRLASREGAYGEAVLEGYNNRLLMAKMGKTASMAIKVKYVSPGQPASRGSYIKIYVNPPSDHASGEQRWGKYNVQIQMNNLTTK